MYFGNINNAPKMALMALLVGSSFWGLNLTPLRVAHVAMYVVIARPPVSTPTPSRRYRRCLASKGKVRFAVYINVIWVGIRSGLPKRRYRVVIDYRSPPVVSWVVSWSVGRVRIWESSDCLWVFVVDASGWQWVITKQPCWI
jgi:hypothetical protein